MWTDNSDRPEEKKDGEMKMTGSEKDIWTDKGWEWGC